MASTCRQMEGLVNQRRLPSAGVWNGCPRLARRRPPTAHRASSASLPASLYVSPSVSLFASPQAPQALPRTRIIRSYPFRHNRPAARRFDGNERQKDMKNAGLENPTGSGTSLLPPHRFQTGVPAAHKANGEMYGLKGKFRMIRGFPLIGAFS